MFAKESEVSLWELNHQKDRACVLLRKGVFFDHPAGGRARTHLLVQQFVCECVFRREAFRYRRRLSFGESGIPDGSCNKAHPRSSSTCLMQTAAATFLLPRSWYVFCDATTDLKRAQRESSALLAG
jgi:hypothetical protein